jgi:ribulose-5-phosphate 4-epimerase/fuculose-1-phosphate aldolase
MALLAEWCGRFDAEGLAPVEGGASAGNLSFRTPAGFVITPTRSRLKSGIRWTDFVEVVRADRVDFVMHVLGSATPSSDAFLHERIYALRPDVQAIFHGHDPLMLQWADALAAELPLKLTRESRAFGTLEDACETASELGSAAAIIRRGHGFVTVGRDMPSAGQVALALHRRAQALARP